MQVQHLKKRAEFLRISAENRKFIVSHFIMLTSPRPAGVEGGVRVGFTVTKKIGNAVVRNRIRRRLREAFREAAPESARAGMDYVLIARKSALLCPYAELIRDLRFALRKIHTPPRRPEPRPEP